MPFVATVYIIHQNSKTGTATIVENTGMQTKPAIKGRPYMLVYDMRKLATPMRSNFPHSNFTGPEPN